MKLERGAAEFGCVECGEAVDNPTATACRSCGGPLMVEVERPFERQRWDLRASGEGLWRFAEILTPIAPASRVTLAEGDTPLLTATVLAKEVGVGRLLLKDESRNPTGTFKDRCLAVASSVAVDCGAPGLICASTGNAGASTAAYAARAGLPAVILIPVGTPPSKLAQTRAYGAQVVAVEGNYSDAYRLAQMAAETLGYVNATTTFVSPYSAEGARSVAYELFEQMSEPPDWIVVPIGAGALLVGVYEAYRDLFGADLVERVPRMLAVQPTGCAPIVRAFEAGANDVAAWGPPTTRVGSLADPLTGYEREGRVTLNAMRASGGAGVAVPDDETIAAVLRLGATGVFAEPGGAIAIAGAAKATAAGLIAPDATVACCITGSGLKDPFAAVLDENPEVVVSTGDDLARWLTTHHGPQGG